MNPVVPVVRIAAAAVVAVIGITVAPAATQVDSGKAGTAPAAAVSFYAAPFEKKPDVATLTALGRKMFFDPALSASGRMACSTCHDPAHAYGPSNAKPVQFGGADLRLVGVRAVPSIRYQQNVPPFTEHYYEDDGDDSVDQGPTGGRGWDGRAGSAHEQAQVPLLSTFEMGNADPAAVVAKVRSAAYAPDLKAAFGSRVLDDPSLAYKAVLWSLEVFQQSPADFYPYDSKYDAWLRHQTALTPREYRGLQAFNDPAKGNCAACHQSAIREGAFPQFTDFGFIAIGVPRNPKIPANVDPGYFDLGLCGPQRTDLKDQPKFCGLFRTPSLRNVALRQTFFHNGVFHNLEDAVRFYALRDTHPEHYYPRGKDGKTAKFNDLPVAYWPNLNNEKPFDREPGDKPALDDAEIRDIVAFLKTLDDGYVVPKPSTRTPAARLSSAR